MKNKTTRRSFLKGAAGLASFTILPSYLISKSFGLPHQLPPSERINLACVGVGGRGRRVVSSLIQAGAQPVAFCDVDFNHKNAGTQLLKDHPKVQRFADFRVMLEKMDKDIDAVSVATPDHTHFPVAMLSMSMGKHVYVEKPLTHTFMEAEMLKKAEKKFGVVTQMGNQGHSSPSAHQFKMGVKTGVIKDIVKIVAWKTPGLWFQKPDERGSQKGFLPNQDQPDSLDWDLWLGPVKEHPYAFRIHPFDWRGYYAFGCGMLGDWGAHIIDFHHDYLKLGLPTKVEVIKIEPNNQIIFPMNTQLKFHFPDRGPGLPAVDLYWKDGADVIPTLKPEVLGKRMVGQKDGTRKMEDNVLGGAGSLAFRKDGVIIERRSHGGDTRILEHELKAGLMNDWKYDPIEINAFSNFLKSIKGEEKTWSPFSVSAELTQILLLGVIAQYLNEDIKFNPKKLKIKGNKKANELLNWAPPRKGWEEFYKMV